MIYIHKNTAPEFLVKYIAKNPFANYDSESFKRYYTTLRKELVEEQKGLCAYCCSKISVENSHNEHIEPRHMKNGMMSKKSLDYNNIVASCNRFNTCGMNKENNYDEAKFVSPLNMDCESEFSYDPDGYINGDMYTISLLNLNSYELRSARKAIYRIIVKMNDEDIRMTYCADAKNYQPYINVIFWYLNNHN